MKMTPAKRFGVRASLVTGTTLATIIGAQALVSLDENTFAATPSPQVAPVSNTDSAANTIMLLPTDPVEIAKAAPPAIVILRHAGQQPVNSPTVNNTVTSPSVAAIQPPNPVQIVAPQPVQQSAPVSAPAVAQTRSTR